MRSVGWGLLGAVVAIAVAQGCGSDASPGATNADAGTDAGGGALEDGRVDLDGGTRDATTSGFSIGGRAFGVGAGGLVLDNGGAESLSISADGAFSFATRATAGADYTVTVKSAPASKRCTIVRGRGKVASGDVTDIVVACGRLMGGTIQGVPIVPGALVGSGFGVPSERDGTGAAASFSSPAGLASDGTNLYVADRGGSTIRKIVLATGAVTTIAGKASEPGSALVPEPRFYYPMALATDGTTLYVADPGMHTIRAITLATGAVTAIAGIPSANGGFSNGPGSTAEFRYPSGLALVGGVLYVADTNNCLLRAIDVTTHEVTTLAGATQSCGSTDGDSVTARFGYPVGLQSNGTDLFVADSSGNAIRRVAVATGATTTIAGAGGSGASDGLLHVGQLRSPQGLAIDGGTLYVADRFNGTLRAVDIATGMLTTLAGKALTGGVDDATGSAARFYDPMGVAVVGGAIYVSDASNGTIRRVTTSGAVTTFAGTAGSTQDRLTRPNGVTTDGLFAYVSDPTGYVVRKIELATGAITTVAGTAGRFGNDNGTGTAALFNGAYSLTTDGANLYVADGLNHRIRQIVLATGAVTTFAGDTQGSTDGTGTGALFDFPLGITTDGTSLFVTEPVGRIRKIAIATREVTTLVPAATGLQYPSGVTTDGVDLYVTESIGHTVRKVSIATGTVSVFAGNGQAGTADGLGTAAFFEFPQGIVTDGTSLWVTDGATMDNHAVRRIEIATKAVTTVAGAAIPGYANGTGTAARFYFPVGITTIGSQLLVGDTRNGLVRTME